MTFAKVDLKFRNGMDLPIPMRIIYNVPITPSCNSFEIWRHNLNVINQVSAQSKSQ